MSKGEVESDVVVVGGGIVGACMTLALAKTGFKVTLLERNPPPLYIKNGPYGLRVSALNLSSQRLLQNLGVWDDIADTRVSAYHEMHVWDSVAQQTNIHFDCVDLQLDTLGHIVENDLIQSVLHAAISRHENVSCNYGALIRQIETAGDSAIVTLQDGNLVAAQLILGADGADSQVRGILGMEADRRSYRQQGIVAVVEPEYPHKNTAWQIFLPTGPLAFLPLQSKRCSIVWSTSDAHAAELLSLDDAEFGNRLTNAFERCLGKVGVCSERAAFPLQYMHAKQYTVPRAALLGDAAHVVHPLAGQGVNLGLMDVAQLADVLLRARRRRCCLGSHKHLRQYERTRKAHNQLMALSFDGLKHLFATQVSPVVSIRNLGLQIVNRFQPAKRLFMEQAAGISGSLPPLALAPELYALQDEHAIRI